MDHERRGLRMSVRGDTVWFWKRMEVKIMRKKFKDMKEMEDRNNAMLLLLPLGYINLVQQVINFVILVVLCLFSGFLQIQK